MILLWIVNTVILFLWKIGMSCIKKDWVIKNFLDKNIGLVSLIKLCCERVNVNENKHPVLGDQRMKREVCTIEWSLVGDLYNKQRK